MDSTIFIKEKMAQSQFSPPQDSVSIARNKFDANYQNRDQAKGYNVGTYEYPEGLRVKPDLQHYVAFYINVREKSSEGKRASNYGDFGEAPRVFKPSDPEAKRIAAERNAASNLSQDALNRGSENLLNNAGSIVGAAVGLQTLFNVAQRAGNGKFLEAAKSAAVGGLVATGAKVATDAAVQYVRTLELPGFGYGTTARLKDVITLHLEERPVVKYGVNYTEKELGLLTGLLAQSSAKDTLSNADIREGAGRILAGLAGVPGAIFGAGKAGVVGAALGLDIGKETLNNLREITTKTRTNPFREVMFESVDYRSFNFRYRFFPKSQAETKRIKDIIDLFKYHMHPEITTNKLFYIYPSEFQIKYYYKNDENKYLHSFATCALTDMQVEYGGDQFATFENGAPVEITMSLTFRELEQMTSEGIRRNGY